MHGSRACLTCTPCRLEERSCGNFKLTQRFAFEYKAWLLYGTYNNHWPWTHAAEPGLRSWLHQECLAWRSSAALAARERQDTGPNSLAQRRCGSCAIAQRKQQGCGAPEGNQEQSANPTGPVAVEATRYRRYSRAAGHAALLYRVHGRGAGADIVPQGHRPSTGQNKQGNARSATTCQSMALPCRESPERSWRPL